MAECKIRKIDLMHRLFGKADGKCGDCFHLVEGLYQTKKLRKCDVYGLTHSEASDWAKCWQACGLFNRETKAERIIDLVRQENKKDVPLILQLDGQIEMEM